MTQDSNNYKINNPEAKEQVEAKAEHLDNVLEQGNQIEKETQGENPDWKAVKDLHAGEAPIDKILYEDKKAPVEEVKEQPAEPEKQPETPKEETPKKQEKAPEPEKEAPQTPPQPEIKRDEPQPTPTPQSKPEPVSEKKKDDDGGYKGYTHRI